MDDKLAQAHDVVEREGRAVGNPNRRLWEGTEVGEGESTAGREEPGAEGGTGTGKEEGRVALGWLAALQAQEA